MDEKENVLIDEPDYPIHLSDENFEEAVKKYSFVVIDLWAPWCMPCNMVTPVIESLAKKHKGKVFFGKVNIDENPAIANKFGVMSIPTLLVFKNGEKVDELVGAMPENMLAEKLGI